MNQTVTLNIVDTTIMIITITITGAIFYVTDNLPCQYGTAFLLAIQYTDFIFQEQNTFGLLSFTDGAVEGWSTWGRCYDVMSDDTLKYGHLTLFCTLIS